MNTRNLVLVGGGGHCHSVIDVAEQAGFNILGVLEKTAEQNKDLLGYKVIGTDDDIPFYVDKALFIITVGQIKNPNIRIKINERIKAAGGKLATIISPDAYVSKYSVIGAGTVIMHKAFVNANATIGENCIINTMANIEHDSVVGDFTHISTGVMINGDCRVGNNVFIGSQSVMSNATSVCHDVVIGAGSFIRKSIHKKGIYSGNPALLKIKL